MSKDDFQRFASEKFLRTADPGILHAFFERYDIPRDALDLSLLASAPKVGCAAIHSYLLFTPKSAMPESLTADLHRIERIGKKIGQEALLQEARRRDVQLLPAEVQGKTSARDLALRAFIRHPDIFEDAEASLAFLQPSSVSEFPASQEGVDADLSEPRLRDLEERARAIFQAELRDEFCKAYTYQDGDEVKISIRHGAVLTITEVVEGQRERIRSFREIDNAVMAYSAMEGRLRVWGCSKASRPALAKAFGEVMLGRENFFNEASSKSLYTLRSVEQRAKNFKFLYHRDLGINGITIYEAQANKIALGRGGRSKTIGSLIAREPEGDALQLLLQSRPEIEFESGNWRLAHLVFKVLLETLGSRPTTITVKIKPGDTLVFPRERHQRLIMDLLRMNEMLCERVPPIPALAAQ
jgi:hypothetical protein